MNLMHTTRSAVLISAAVLCAGLATRATGDDEFSEEGQYTTESSSQAAGPGGAKSVGGAGIQTGQSIPEPDGGYSGERSGSSPSAARSPSATASSSPGQDENLHGTILERAGQIAASINKTGGYRFDGRNDCYGFVRRVWDPVLSGVRQRPLPVSDYVSREWAPITSWSLLMPGDVLATHQGHKWGASWHGGLFFGIIGGKAYSFDNSPQNHGGAYPRVAPSGIFRYYNLRTHQLLAGQSGKAAGK